MRKKKKAGAGAKGVCGCETLIRAYDGRDGKPTLICMNHIGPESQSRAGLRVELDRLRTSRLGRETHTDVRMPKVTDNQKFPLDLSQRVTFQLQPHMHIFHKIHNVIIMWQMRNCPI